MKPTTFLLFSLGPCLLAAFLLWLGAPMVVQCDRIAAPRDEKVLALEKGDTFGAQESAQKSRVDVTMHKRLVGVLTVKSERLIDVVGGHSYVRSSRGSRSRGGDTGTVLKLDLRDGSSWESPGAYSPIGTPPDEMATRLKEFIKIPSAPSLRMWCMSWVLHVAGLPLLLMGVFCAYAGLNVLRKNLVEGRSPNAAFRG